MTEFFRLSEAKKEEIENKKQRSKLLFNSDTLSDVKFVVRASLGENENSRGKLECQLTGSCCRFAVTCSFQRFAVKWMKLI